MDWTCEGCKKQTAYPDQVFDSVPKGPVKVWHTSCWNEKHPDEQYSDDVRHGDGHRGERST